MRKMLIAGIEDEDYEKFRSYCKRRKKSMTSVIRSAIMRVVRAEEGERREADNSKKH